MDLLQQLRDRLADPQSATDDGAGIKDFAPLPPVSRDTILAAENILGFALPPLLVDIYTTVANGGIGPGYGFFRLHAVPKTGDLIETYQYMTHSDPQDQDWKWPDLLLPVISHGCGIYECVDCRLNEAPVILHHPDFLVGRSVPSTLHTLSPTLSDRLLAWIHGEPVLRIAVQSLQERSER